MSRMMNRIQKNIGDSLIIPLLSAAFVAVKQGKTSNIVDFSAAVRDVMKCPPVEGEPYADEYRSACEYLKGGKA